MSVDVEVGHELDDWVRRVARQAAPTVAPRMEQEVRELIEEIKKRWPVDPHGKTRPGRIGRPHTRDGFRAVLTVTQDGIEARITNDFGADYFYKIRSEQNDLEGKSPFVTLVRTPARKRAKALADDLSEDLVRMAGG